MAEEKAVPVQTTWLVWGSLLSCLGFYGFIGLQQSPQVAENVEMMQQVFGAVAFATASSVYLLRPVLAKGSNYFTYCVIRWALCESIGIYGLLLGFMGAGRSVMLAFLGVAAVLILLNAPTADALERYNELKNR